MPFFKRVKVLHLTPFELPRTATRKVKRPEVVEFLQNLETRAKNKTKQVVETKGDDTALWIRKIVASVANRPLSDVALSDKLSDLGFDSLMFVELQGAVEDAGGRVPSPDTLNEVETVRELITAVQRVDKSKKIVDEPRNEDKKDDELYVPSIVRRVGNSLVDFAQEKLYENVLETKIEGESNVPVHTNFIVAPNHTSHLDTGLGQTRTRQRRGGTNGRGRGGGLLVRHEIQTRVYEQFHDARSHRTHGQSAPISAPRNANLRRRLQRADLPRRRSSGIGTNR